MPGNLISHKADPCNLLPSNLPDDLHQGEVLLDQGKLFPLLQYLMCQLHEEFSHLDISILIIRLLLNVVLKDLTNLKTTIKSFKIKDPCFEMPDVVQV